MLGIFLIGRFFGFGVDVNGGIVMVVEMLLCGKLSSFFEVVFFIVDEGDINGVK